MELDDKMNLQDFIRDTIIQVQIGINEARVALEGVPGVINPVWGDVSRISEENIQNIDFDIAVTVDSSTKGGVKGSSSGFIKVLAADIDANGELSRGRSSVSRVTFSVPYIPPVTIVQAEK